MTNPKRRGSTRPVSVRLNAEELAQLEGLDLPGARTAGQKLRALLAEAGTLRPSDGDYAALLGRLQGQVQPLVQAVREAEREHGLRSELVPRMADGLAEAMAWLLAEAGEQREPDPSALARLESGLADRSAALARHLLEVYRSGDSAAYDRAALAARVRPLAALADVPDEKRAKKKKEKPGKKDRKAKKSGK
jgi:hypothetical protein